MNTTQRTDANGVGNSPFGSFRNSFSDAIRFWEPRRVIYNLILATVTILWLVMTWPHFRPALNLTSLLLVCVMALLANVCYCAAYLVDLPLQRSSLNANWKRHRSGLWLAGTLFAVVLANYWIVDEIYPFVR
jgi:hypothetical protein